MFWRPSAHKTATQGSFGLPGWEGVHAQLRHAVGESSKACCWGRKGFPLHLGNSKGDAPQAWRFGGRCADEFGDQQAGTLLPLGYPGTMETCSSSSWRWRSSLHVGTLHLGLCPGLRLNHTRLGGCPLTAGGRQAVPIAYGVREDSPFLLQACRGSAKHFEPGQWGKSVAPQSLRAMALRLHLMPGRRGWW